MNFAVGLLSAAVLATTIVLVRQQKEVDLKRPRLTSSGETPSTPISLDRIRELGGDRYRYGVHSVQDKASGGDLRKGQQLISASLEREQLRRLAGSG